MRNVTEYAKRQQCWAIISKLEIPLPPNLDSSTISLNEARQREKNHIAMGRIHGQLDLERDLVALQPRICEIRDFARAKRLLSPKSSTALDKAERLQLPMSTAETNALRYLFKTLEKRGCAFLSSSLFFFASPTEFRVIMYAPCLPGDLPRHILDRNVFYRLAKIVRQFRKKKAQSGSRLQCLEPRVGVAEALRNQSIAPGIRQNAMAHPPSTSITASKCFARDRATYQFNRSLPSSLPGISIITMASASNPLNRCHEATSTPFPSPHSSKLRVAGIAPN